MLTELEDVDRLINISYFQAELKIRFEHYIEVFKLDSGFVIIR
jgi:hypothetical protein